MDWYACWRRQKPRSDGKNLLFLVQAVHHLRFHIWRNDSETKLYGTERNPQSMDITVHITILVHIQLLNRCMIALWKRNGNFYWSTTVHVGPLSPALTCLYYPFPLPRLLVLTSTRTPMCRTLVSLLIRRWWLSLGESSPHLYCSTGGRLANMYVVCQLQCTVPCAIESSTILVSFPDLPVFTFRLRSQ